MRSMSRCAEKGCLQTGKDARSGKDDRRCAVEVLVKLVVIVFIRSWAHSSLLDSEMDEATIIDAALPNLLQHTPYQETLKLAQRHITHDSIAWCGALAAEAATAAVTGGWHCDRALHVLEVQQSESTRL